MVAFSTATVSCPSDPISQTGLLKSKSSCPSHKYAFYKRRCKSLTCVSLLYWNLIAVLMAGYKAGRDNSAGEIANSRRQIRVNCVVHWVVA